FFEKQHGGGVLGGCTTDVELPPSDSPWVKLLGLGGAERITILQGCPGERGLTGAKGDQGPAGLKGTLLGTEGKPRGDRRDQGTTKGVWEKGEPLRISPSLGRNCMELLNKGHMLSGWYTIYPKDCKAITVLCDLQTVGGGWIVLQRRADGTVDFHRDWNEYKAGFGTQMSEFWLGNDNIHMLTSIGNQELRIDLRDFENNLVSASYKSFKILGEGEKYKLILGEFTGGTAGDSLSIHKNMPFSTKDHDSDHNPDNCAVIYIGAWWYNSCLQSNLNGFYWIGKQEKFSTGINWQSGKGLSYSYKLSEMKFRPG
uniref:Fibrinogen C-terminal domain-containing protein n=1 Tax=Sphenodon punctatus TaxID=8508 RepID=A0A8D0GW14_SPHPU